MENDNDINCLYENKEEKIFRFLYSNQNIEKIKDFQNWKLEIEKKYDKKIFFYKCNKDRIYFYEEKDDEFEYYEGKCPECKQYICSFCSKNIIGYNHFSRYMKTFCCLKRSIYFILFREKFNNNEYPIISFILGFLAFIIPFCNIFGIILCIIQNLFCIRKPKKYYNDDKILSYHYFFHHKKAYANYNCLILINIGFSLCLGICFMNLACIYMVIMLLLSIPFKLRPIFNLLFYVSENASESYGDCFCFMCG